MSARLILPLPEKEISAAGRELCRKGDRDMFDMFFPDEYVASTYIIPFEKLYEEGYRGVIFDIDNTLVPHGAPADTRAKELFARLKSHPRHGADGNGPEQYGLCGGSAVYRRVGGKTDRNPQYSGQAHVSQGGDPDRFEALSGADRAVFLQKKAKKDPGKIKKG